MYRLVWVSQALAAQGYDVTLDYDRTYRALCSDRGGDAWRIGADPVVGVDIDFDADVIVFQRVLDRRRYELLCVLKEAGITVVVEIDDDFHAIHKLNAAWKGTSPLHSPESNRDWLMRACQVADLVTVTTPALAERYGEHGRVAILPNYVPARYLDIAGQRDGDRIGWSGSIATHPGDLQVTGGAIAEVAGARVAVVGTGKLVAEALKVETVESGGWLPIDEYPHAVARFDVGIVPLRKSAFNEAKSSLKGLEMAAVGVPFVATPTGPYRALAEEGIGWLADSPDEWRAKVSLLIADHDLRAELGQRWRQVVRERFTIEQHAVDWWGAWTMTYADKVAA